jgi:diguanylate cyclase (GGDEF)-like protein
VSGIEKDFFRHPTIDAILDNMVDIIRFAFECDRMTLSMRSDDGSSAAIRRVYGVHTRGLDNHVFSLGEKTLASILYSKNICFSRNFATERNEVRYFEKEPRDEEFGSFLAVPFGVDGCKGMILLESFRRDAFSATMRELLWGIATSAGLAIEKIAILEKTEAIATHDGLTGLFNHRQFQQLLKEEITRSGRYDDPLALVICDIDFFKKINDTYGHPFGDTVLKEVSRLFESGIRGTIDTAARYGGEEFALILVKTDEAQAVETAERIRATIERTKFINPAGGEVCVTMSFGIAVLGKHARELNDLIRKADKALYRAKANGRNRVEVF